MLTLFSQARGADEVLIIKSVSQSKKRFAIGRGLADGIVRGQKSLFTNDNTSFYATATEVNRTHSLWDISDKRAKVPFENGDFVSFTNSGESIWMETPKLILNTRTLGELPSAKWLTRVHATLALGDSTAGVEEARQVRRYGFQWDILYNKHFRHNLEYGLGARFDREVSSLAAPRIDTITRRWMLQGEITYHLEELHQQKGHFYGGIGLAYGISNTSVGDTLQSGNVLALPIVRLGYLQPYKKGQSFLFELSAESLSSKEAFQDRAPQSYTILNSKATVGFKF